VEGAVSAAEGQVLPNWLGSRKGWVNLTNVHFRDSGERQKHVAIHTSRVLWAHALDNALPVVAPNPAAKPRSVEIHMADGLVLHGSLSLLPRQRLSDYLGSFGEFIPVRDARVGGTSEPLGDIAVNQEAIERLRDADGGDGADSPEAGPESNRAPARPARPPSPPRRAEEESSNGSASHRADGGGVRHWLLNVARSTGAPNSENLFTAATVPIADAWTAVADGCRLSDEQLAHLVAAHYRLGVADLDNASPELIQRIPERIARKYCIFPLREENGHLVIATSDPTDHDAEQALRFASRKRPIFEIAPPGTIQHMIGARYNSDRVVELLLNSVDTDPTEVRVVEDVDPESVREDEIDAAPIIKLTSLILRDAVRDGASDIHLEPTGANSGVVRYRVDGVLRHHMQVPLTALNRVISRIKILGELDIADRLRPQDGRTRIQIEGRTQDLRISTVPTRQSEKAVIRILNPEGNRSLDDLQLPAHELDRFRQLLSYREGITVVTGPTGSGKTTTLYAALREASTGEVNVMSVEDPVEYELSNITQIQVAVDRGVTFATALRAILRQDPDIIFVGEIRDAETAEVAVHASMTGHLVLATLHTNDAVSSVARLAQLGLDGASIASTLRGAVAQRLLRRSCPHCTQMIEGELTPEEERLGGMYAVRPLVRTKGCKRCAQTGYKGRLPVVEVMLSNAHIRELISHGASESEIYRASIVGTMRPMLAVALDRVREGETTLQEVERVLGGVHSDWASGETVAARIYAEAMKDGTRDPKN
jgi:type II secretory ATPase GspE/PulE/Tfp pilus assembly ATPase PilB-like protein